MDSASGNYHIDIGSAAIDQGTNAGVIDDMDGEPRDALPDLGADEFTLPVAPSLSITASGADTLLTWEHSAYDSAGYEIWWSTNPYFFPLGPDTHSDIVEPASGTLSYRHSGALADVDNSYFYLVLGPNKAGKKSDISNRVGEFGYDITPGSSQIMALRLIQTRSNRSACRGHTIFDPESRLN